MSEERQDPAAAVLGDVAGEVYGDLARTMGIEYLEASPERVVGRMPVKGNTQPYGLLHGGASCVLAESLGSVGSALHAGRDRIAVGIEISATHHRSAAEGWITGVATRMHGGRTLATYDIVLTDDQDRRVCTARLTCMLRDKPTGEATGKTAN
ncbi:PaaI family thioesterase [Actinomadura sp. 9N407]|uniref:PaaI family thioesterase n=1 Tax=Actinomadura sp. 9N407 TaxID=3375154 RepID=UPI0037ACA667